MRCIFSLLNRMVQLVQQNDRNGQCVGRCVHGSTWFVGMLAPMHRNSLISRTNRFTNRGKAMCFCTNRQFYERKYNVFFLYQCMKQSVQKNGRDGQFVGRCVHGFTRFVRMLEIHGQEAPPDAVFIKWNACPQIETLSSSSSCTLGTRVLVMPCDPLQRTQPGMSTIMQMHLASNAKKLASTCV